jgi:hypothetical protein
MEKGQSEKEQSEKEQSEKEQLEKEQEEIPLENLFTREEYLDVLKDTSEIAQKLLRDLEAIKSELDNERQKNKDLEKELWDYRETASCINRRQFSSYVQAAKNRPASHKEWLDFIETFDFSFQQKLITELYVWVDKHCK